VQFAPAPKVAAQLLVWEKSPVAAPIEIVVDPVPEFVTVTVLPALVVPTVCEVNVKLEGDGVTVTVPVPVPVNATCCGEFAALLVTVIFPDKDPVTVGENVAVTVQVAPAPNELPQLLVCPKLALAPTEIEVDAEPVFFTVIACPALVVPTA
jgi:hypothetical protein